MKRLGQHIAFVCCALGGGMVHGQDAWPVDSLLTTWPMQQRFQESRVKPGLGAHVTDGLYTELQRAAPALPVFADDLVDRSVTLFSGPRRDHFRVVLGAAEAHLPMIERELARHGLPNELKYLPFALSAFNPQAASNNGEAGLWMLTYPVAMKHGLEVSTTIDERRDPLKSTVAAMRHLQDLHARYGDWPTAVIAFTCGPANLTRARQRSGIDMDPRLLYPHFSPGHRAVLPRLMAFTFLALNAEGAGLDPLVFRVQEPSDTVRFDSTLVIEALTNVLGTRPERFRSLNPVLTGSAIPAGTPFLLPRSEAGRFGDMAFIVLEAQSTVPRRSGSDTAAVENVEQLPDGREAILYRIEEGDHLGGIAERFGVGLSELRDWNDQKSDHIDVGNTLVLYVPRTTRLVYEGVNSVGADSLATPQRSDTVRTTTRTPQAPVQQGDYTWYTVRSGDSLYVIARRHPGISSEDLMEFNGIGANIRPGQRIKIPKR